MSTHSHALGKRAAAFVPRTATIPMASPGAQSKAREAMATKKHRNSTGPWQKGRKIKK